MDLDLPRPSQDGRVYWDSGPNDLLAQLQKTSLEHSDSSAKRSSLSAGFPSPTRPGSDSSASSLSFFDTSSSTASSSSSSTSSTTGASVHAGARFGKRRKQQSSSLLRHSLQPSSLTGGSRHTLDASALRRIGEISALLDAQQQQLRPSTAKPPVVNNKARSNNNNNKTALLDKTSATANADPFDVASKAKPPLPLPSKPAGPQQPPQAKPTARRATSTSSVPVHPQPPPQAKSVVGRSKSATHQVISSVQPPKQPLRSSPAKPLGARSAPEGDSAQGDNNEDDSFDVALGGMPAEDFDAIIMSASQQQQQQHASSSSQGGGLPTSKPKPARQTKARSPAITTTTTNSKDKLKAPFKAPSRTASPRDKQHKPASSASSQASVHPELQAALEAGMDFAEEDVSF